MNETTSAVEWRRRILATTAFFAWASVSCTNLETMSAPNFGYIRATVTSSGGDLDIDGYLVVVDAKDIIKIPANQTLASIDVETGPHAVTLQNVADNCAVQGENLKTVTVEKNRITDVKFDVDCAVTGIAVTTRTTGSDTPNVLRLSLDGQDAVAPSSGLYSIGRLAAKSYVIGVVAPANCTVTGGAQVTVTVTSRAVTPVMFDVTCTAIARLEKIVFVEERTSPTRQTLKLVNPDGTGLTTLQDGNAPSWSPDRTRLAFSTTSCYADDYYYFYYGDTCSGGILLLDPETGNVTTTTGGSSYNPSWAPTGVALVLEGFGVYDRDMSLHVLQLSSGNVSSLDIQGPASSEQPAWSPDGTRIAFVCRWSVNTDICIVNADGTGLVRMTNDAPDDLHPKWSPNGTRIAFARHPRGDSAPTSGEIVVVDVATGAATVLTPGTEPTWAPDGSRLAFAGIDGLFVIGADGTNLKRLTTGYHRAPAWRP